MRRTDSVIASNRPGLVYSSGLSFPNSTFGPTEKHFSFISSKWDVPHIPAFHSHPFNVLAVIHHQPKACIERRTSLWTVNPTLSQVVSVVHGSHFYEPSLLLLNAAITDVSTFSVVPLKQKVGRQLAKKQLIRVPGLHPPLF
ncbi:hypothetical protein BLNAU_19757 [Blattamonas nauphoetae]|uniref:Uncharacterized protein n=1 Tax=Blattamonas nauphoetae TaxID=2049346 RepID=A0ABQ9X0L8_9EUKA|nr:hypothetical protein BLNAU_19757 [Blattamonas nauphoetae]